MSAIATAAPSAASRWAIASPIPRAAPVMIATLPLSRPVVLAMANSSGHRPPAVDHKWRAGGERGVIAGEVERSSRDLVGVADAIEDRVSSGRIRVWRTA